MLTKCNQLILGHKHHPKKKTHTYLHSLYSLTPAPGNDYLDLPILDINEII